MSLHLPRTLRAGAGLLAGVLLLGGTVGVANAAETDRHAAEINGLRDRTAVMYDRLDGAITRARNAVADTTADQYDDPTLLDEITRTLDHYDAYDPHLPANIDPSKVSLDAVEANLDAAYANAADWLTDANTLIDRAVQSRNLKTFHDAESRLAGALEEARATLTDSDGRVDSTGNRDELSALADEADATLAAARDRHDADGDAIAGDWTDMTGMADRLDAERGQVETDMEAFEARVAAEQAAVQASYDGTNGSWGDPYYSSYVSYSNTPSGYRTSGSCAMDPSIQSPGSGCQGLVDGGGLAQLTWGQTTIYAQHANTGGAWINGLTAGQTVTINGQRYVVNGQSQEGAYYSPDNGTWLQTCNGNGNHLVGITPIG